MMMVVLISANWIVIRWLISYLAVYSCLHIVHLELFWYFTHTNVFIYILIYTCYQNGIEDQKTYVYIFLLLVHYKRIIMV